MKILLVNGPPSSGKDALGECLRPAHVTKFAKGLKERTHALYCMHGYPHDFFESRKNKPCQEFLGITPRQAYIEVSENHFKRLHGQGIFGEFVRDELRARQQISPVPLAVITDSGFLPEAEVIIGAFDDVRIVRMHRQRCNFKGDSRGYIYPKIPSLDVENVGTLDDLRSTAAFIGDWLNDAHHFENRHGRHLVSNSLPS
jgi:hypothetical protein